MDVRTLLTPGKNPFFEHAEAQYFIAERDGRPVGRIAAIKNDAHTREHGDRVGFYGFFESVNEQPVANALFDAAARWLSGKDFQVMRGPMNPSVNDDCGLLVEGFDTPPTIMMPHNPPYYVALHQGYGFTKAKDLIAFASPDGDPPERITRAVNVIAERKGITLRPLNMKRFKEEVELVKALYNQAWERNWGFVPLTNAEIDHLAKQLKPIVVPDLVCFAERKGQVIGFAVALPDFNVALKHNPSGRIWGIPKILWYARGIRRCARGAGPARTRRPGDVPGTERRQGAGTRLDRCTPGPGRSGGRRRAARWVCGRRGDLPRGGAHQRPRHGRVHARQPRRDGERARGRGAGRRAAGTLRVRLVARGRGADGTGETNR